MYFAGYITEYAKSDEWMFSNKKSKTITLFTSLHHNECQGLPEADLIKELYYFITVNWINANTTT